MMNLFGLSRILQKNNKKKSSLDLRKTQSTGNITQIQNPIPVNITYTTPANLKPILAKSTSHFKPLIEVEEEEGKEKQNHHPNNNHNNNDDENSQNSSQSQSSSKSSSLKETSNIDQINNNDIEGLSEKLKTITADDMELLLSMETQARMDHLAEQQEKEKERRIYKQQQSKKLKFALPDMPLRESSMIHPNTTGSNITIDHQQQNDYNIPIAKRWSLPEESIRQDMKKRNHSKSSTSKWMKYLTLNHYDNDNNHHHNTNHHDDSNNMFHQSLELKYGSKVKLIRSPIKTTAYVRYVGPVHFAPGEYVGVELERAVGKNDGSVDGQRYFHTGAYRGIFLTRDELLVVK
ncbi:unnamed protein product [Cunninghamella blakesleeana]